MYLRVFSKADATRTAKHLQLSAFKRWMDGLGSLQLARTGGGERIRANRNLSLSLSRSNPTWQWSGNGTAGLGENSDVGRHLWWRLFNYRKSSG